MNDTIDNEIFEEGQAFDVLSKQSGASFVVDLEGFLDLRRRRGTPVGFLGEHR